MLKTGRFKYLGGTSYITKKFQTGKGDVSKLLQNS